MAGSTPRLLYIDNLRMTLITLMVAGHLAITYGGIGDWYYKEAGSASPAFIILLLPLGAILAASLLGLFSLIAGYFTPRPYDRKGPGPFMLDRIKRLAIPLAIYELLLNPATRYFRDVKLGRFQGNFLEYWRAYFSPLKSIADGPIWYLEMLLIFSLVYTGWRLAMGAGRRGPRRSTAGVPGNGAIALFASAMGLVTFVVRIWAPVGHRIEPWHQEPAHYPQYIAMFMVGILAYRRDWPALFPDAQARLWRRLSPLIVVAFAGIAVSAGVLQGKLDESIAGGCNAVSLAFSMWEAWTCVIVSVLMLVWYRRRFNHQGRLARTLAASAFGVYVIHPAIIVPLAVALRNVPLSHGLKFIGVTPIALALCYLIAGWLRKIPFVRRVF